MELRKDPITRSWVITGDDILGDETASPYQQAQIIYEYVVGVMSYDKTGKGWGRGDAIYACDVRRGNSHLFLRYSFR